MKNSELITLTRSAVIDYKGIEDVTEEVGKRIASLDLEKQVATVQTVKALKQTRAELNKEFKIYEEQRKFVKNAYAKPYTDFETKYKELAVKFKNADNILRSKIFSVENDLKIEKTNNLKTYFTELCQSKEIDFLTFENASLNVTLSASEKSLKEKINAFVGGVKKDLDLINSIPESDEFKTDVLVDYKRGLDINKSLRIVQERRKAKEQELKRIAKQKEQEEKVETTAKEQPALPPTPLQAPKAEQKIEILEATFTVKGTLKQLKSLKEFIIQNNIELI